MNLDQQIKDWVEKEINGKDIFFVDLEVKPGFKRLEISLLLDTMEGIQIEDCAKVSRGLSNWIEENNLIAEAYNLEVSSPGIDKPLKYDWQFVKNKGRKIKIWMKEEENMEGELEGKEGEEIIFFKEKRHKHLVKKEKEATRVSLDKIDKIKVQVSF
ncbi:MAG: hypothetical protein RIR51_2164 [Bacteroidota bacterium]|jgi:ribosome maturation factor RimP